MNRLIVILFFIIPFALKGQTGNHVFFGGMTLTKESIPTIDESLPRIGSRASAISNYNGNLLVYSSYNKIYNGQGILLNPNDQIMGGYHSSNNSVMLTINDSTYINIAEKLDKKIKYFRFSHLTYTQIQSNSSGVSIDPTVQNIDLDSHLNYGLAVIEDTLGGTWLISRVAQNVIKSYYFSENCMACKTRTSYIPEQIDTLWPIEVGNSPFLRRSPSGNFIATGEIQRKLNRRSQLEANTVRLKHFKFDKTTGYLTFLDQPVYQQDTALTNSNASYFSDLNVAYSSDDKSLCISLFKRRSRINGVQDETYYLSSYNIQSRQISAITQFLNPSKNPDEIAFNDFINIKKKQIGFIGYQYDPKRTYIGYVNVAKNGNVTLGSKKSYSFDTKYVGLGNSIGYSKYNYIKTDFTLDYDCQANLKITDDSDSGLANTKLSYFLEKTAGLRDFVPINPSNSIPIFKNGDYLLKVILKSDLGEYKERYYDTIKVRIPEKPVANFIADDTVVCAYTNAVFRNFSIIKDFHPSKTSELIWDFGDGNTLKTNYTGKVDEIKHQYDVPGIYNVSLKIYNGYCDSTLIKSKYVRVVDAPKPGFEIDNNRGCSPFNIQITDTVSKNVTKKEYYFSDQAKWRDLNSEKLKYTFDSAGVFYAVQRLHGHTGCITQKDTAWFYVTAGFTNADSIHVTWLSFKNNLPFDEQAPGTIQIRWSSHKAAVEYVVLEESSSGLNKFQVKDNNQIDLSNEYGSAPTYKVFGIDSCGMTSSIGAIGQPIWLDGRIIGTNDQVELWYSKYAARNSDEYNYKLYQLEGVGTIEKAKESYSGKIIDQDFLVDKQERICYFIEKNNSENEPSYSNIICIPLKPQIFIPNAISINNDGLNDVFIPKMYGITSYTLKIYNRWGEKVHESIDSEWKPQNNELGIFSYSIEFKTSEGEWIRKKGTINVIK